MKRDLSLIREILLAVEAGGISTHIFISRPKPPLDQWTSGEIAYHVQLMKQAGLLPENTSIPIGMSRADVFGLTWEGHDYLDTIRDPEVWKKTKATAEKAGGWTFGLVKEIGLAIIKGELRHHGVPLI